MDDQVDEEFEENETPAEVAKKIILVAIVCAMVMIFFLGM